MFADEIAFAGKDRELSVLTVSWRRRCEENLLLVDCFARSMLKQGEKLF